MRKKLIIDLLIVVSVITAFISACAQGTGTVRVTTIPAPNADEPSYTRVPLSSDMTVKEELYTDINNDGTEEKITIASIDSDDEIEFTTVLEVSGITGTYKESIEGCEYVSCCIITVPSGKACFLISLSEHVSYCSKIYSFDGIRPVELCDLGHITDVSGTDITEEGPVDALGTWHYSRTYKLNDDLSLVPGEFQIIMDDKKPLHTIMKLPVELLKDGIYIKDYIDKGKDIIPVSTDGKTYLKFRLEDNTEGRIILLKADSYDLYDSYDSVCLIDGKSEFEYLENIDYTDMWY